jgi:hypothetical protein
MDEEYDEFYKSLTSYNRDYSNEIYIDNDEIEQKNNIEEYNEKMPTIIYNNYEELYKIIYNQQDNELDIKTTDYSNINFCNYCKNYQIIPNCEVDNFISKHIISNINTKYLKIIFKLSPQLFYGYDIFKNKYLKKQIVNILNSETEKEKINLYEIEEDEEEKDKKIMDILTIYCSKTPSLLNIHIYDNLFYQPNLCFIDYLKCDICKNYVCPMHTYLSNPHFSSCNYCDKKWSICGWCKSNFNERYGCKYIHK